MKLIKMFGLLAALAMVQACNQSVDNTGKGSGSDQTLGSDRGSSSGQNTNSVTGPNSAGATTDADNTRRNARDRSEGALTAEEQGGTAADREMTRQIRRAITSDGQLSTEAKNVKIITQNGKVTLRGPVSSEQERQAVATAAQKVAGNNAVDNQLEVKAQNQ